MSYLALLKSFGCPQHVKSFELRIAADQISVAVVTYYPVDSKGDYILDMDNECITTLAEDFVLVPRQLFDTLPETFRRQVLEASR